MPWPGWGIIIALAAGWAATQDPARPADPASARTQTARIYFSALDKQEQPVLGLTEKDFDLRVDGKRAPMESFRAGLPQSDRSVPLVAWILLDFNPNINKRVVQRQADAVAAAFDMFHPASAIGVKLVSDRSETLAPLAHDPEAVRNAFTQYEQRREELHVGIKAESVVVGEAGIAGALGFALDEIDEYVGQQPSLRDREVQRAAVLISDGNLNPSYNLKPLYARAAREGYHLYPVFVPSRGYGPWLHYFFDLAAKTAGVASFFGALRPGSEIYMPPRNNQGPNAITVNFIHIARDLNGKYSFALPLPASGQSKLKLSCKVKGVKIRLPRNILP